MSVQIRNPELVRLLAADFVTRRELVTTPGNRVTLTNSSLTVSGGGDVTLSAAGNYTLTIPASGTVALLGAANVFTAQLEIDTTTGGFVVPRMTNTQVNALTPVDGMIVYNTSASSLQVYSGAAWLDVSLS